MKIILLNPPAYLFDVDQPPVGLLYVAGALMRAGHEVELKDLQADKMTVEETRAWVEGREYDVLGLGGVTSCYSFIKDLVRGLKKNSDKFILVGGVIASAADILLKNAPVDAVCIEEGEIAAVEIMKRLETGGDWRSVKGIAFLREGRVIRTEPQEHIKDLDSIPLPPYELVDMRAYLKDPRKDRFFNKNLPALAAYQGEYALNIKTARGCAFRCAFCYRHFRGFRQHSVDYVINHLKFIRDKYNVKYFRFGDELFTINKKWVLEFTERVLKEKLGIFYVVHGARADTVNEEVLNKLKESGCVAIFYGYESGSQVVLNEMNKRIRVEENLKVARMTNAAGLDSLAQIIVGFPSESPRTIRETADFLVRGGFIPDRVAIGFATPFPGTWLYQYAREHGMIPDEDAYLSRDILTFTHNLTYNFTRYPRFRVKGWPEEILNRVKRAFYKRLHNRPRYLFTFLPRAVRDFIRYIYHGLKRKAS